MDDSAPSAAYRIAARASAPADRLLDAIAITVPGAQNALRAINDTEMQTIDGHDYNAIPFIVRWPNQSSERLPRAQLAIDNVGRDLTSWLHASGGLSGARVKLMRILRSETDAGDVTLAVGRAVELDVMGVRMEALAVHIDLGNALSRDQPAVAARITPIYAPSIFESR